MPKQQKNAPNLTDTAVDTENATNGGGTAATKPKQRGGECKYASKVKPYLAEIARYARCGVTEGQLCEYYGVGKTQWAAYKKKYPELTEILYKARQELKTDLINKSYQVAMGYDYEEVTTVEEKTPSGQVVGIKTTTYKRHAKADAAMIQFLLINRFPAEYARDPHAVELRKKALQLAAQGKINPDELEGL